jgi:hypothetical protein
MVKAMRKVALTQLKDDLSKYLRLAEKGRTNGDSQLRGWRSED